MKTFLRLIFFTCLCGHAYANDQLRNWKFASGETLNAEIVSFDEVRNLVTLRLSDETMQEVDESEFSTLDRAWILQWVEKAEEAKMKLEEVGGRVMEYRAQGKYTTDYAVYYPPVNPDVEAGSMLILILMHPGGNGKTRIYAYIEAAAATGMTLVSLDTFRNTGDSPKREADLLERFNELLPHIEATVPHNPKRIFMGGTSGGAWRSYHYSAQVDRPWAGILAGGGWLGGRKYYDLPYPAMRVALVNGDKDFGANGQIDPDSERLQEAGCLVSVHAFEGGHQLPPPSVQKKAMAWLLAGPFPAEALP